MLVKLTTEVMKRAREASEMSSKAAADACGIDANAYYVREKYPDMFRMGELARLYTAMSDSGRRVLSSAVGELFIVD